MKLIILGSGTSVPHPKRCSPAFWLETLFGNILLDAGAEASHRMAQEQLDWPNLDAIWVSHFHLDHMGGLAPLLFGFKWAPQAQDRTKPLKIFGPAGLHDLISSIDASNNYRLLAQRFDIEIKEVAKGIEFEILPGIVAQTMKTPHTKESLALRLIGQDGKLFVYTSDTGCTDELITFANAADLYCWNALSGETNHCRPTLNWKRRYILRASPTRQKLCSRIFIQSGMLLTSWRMRNFCGRERPSKQLTDCDWRSKRY